VNAQTCNAIPAASRQSRSKREVEREKLELNESAFSIRWGGLGGPHVVVLAVIRVTVILERW
jgi:hypothetical protein